MTMNSVKKIPPGAYRLDRDVVNPKPDRRMTRDWRKRLVWELGTEFVVIALTRVADALVEDTIRITEADVAEADVIRAANVYTVVEMAGDRHSVLHRVGPGDFEQYQALAAALVPCAAESLDQWATRVGCDSTFARWLGEVGALPLPQLEALWRRYQHGETLDSDSEPTEEHVHAVHPIDEDD